MHLIRRAALRVATGAPSKSFISAPRSISTSSPFLLRSKIQSAVSPAVFRRFASDEAAESRPIESADAQQEGSVQAAIDSSNAFDNAEPAATESASEGGRAFGVGEGRRYEQRTPREERDGGRDNIRPPRVVQPSSGIYIGNLLFDVTSSDLEREFAPFGNIKSAVVASDARGLSKGFGYVEFESIEQAKDAIAAKNQTIFEGRRLIVAYMARTVREHKENPPSKTLFIGNLAFEMSDSDLNKLFRDIRNVLDVRVAIDRRTGQPRGFAHADFVDVDSAIKGKDALAGKEVYGRKLRVDYSAGREPRFNNDRRGSSGSSGSSF